MKQGMNRRERRDRRERRESGESGEEKDRILISPFSAVSASSAFSAVECLFISEGGDWIEARRCPGWGKAREETSQY